MTTQQAIAKASAVNLQEALGVPIMPSVMLGRHVRIPEDDEILLIDRKGPNADQLFSLVIGCILRVARESMAENSITQLKTAELAWIEPDPQSTKGYYRLYLATAP